MKSRVIKIVAYIFILNFAIGAIIMFFMNVDVLTDNFKKSQDYGNSPVDPIEQMRWELEEHYFPKIDSMTQVNPTGALYYINKVMDKYTNNKDLLERRGIIEYNLKQYSAAIADFEACLKYPDNKTSDLLHNAALCKKQLGDYDGALAYLKEEAAINQNYGVNITIAQVYEKKGNIPKALEYYDGVIGKMKNDSNRIYYIDDYDQLVAYVESFRNKK
jgi:tetratricopeptide (TPR) repeat protein